MKRRELIFVGNETTLSQRADFFVCVCVCFFSMSHSIFLTVNDLFAVLKMLNKWE